MGYQRKALIGITWVGLLRVMLRSSALVRTAILARLLGPEEFGVFGIAAIVLGLTEMFTETGVNVVLIQDQDPNWRRKLNTAWVISIIRGVLITVIMLLTSPVVVTFFRSPETLPVIAILALVPLVRGFINPAIVTFQKDLRFDAEFRFRSGIIVADALVAISYAVLVGTAASLAWGLLAGALTEVGLSLLFIRPRPQLRYHPQHARSIIHQGKWITGAGIFAYFAAKTPDIVIGRLLGTAQLGYFQMAYRFALIPIEELIETTNRVAFPLYAKLGHELFRIKRAFLQNLKVFAILSTLWGLGLILISEPFTRYVLGPQWLPIVPLLRALCLSGVVMAISAPVNPVFLAIKKQRYLTLTTFVQFLLIALLIVPLTLLFGLVGTAFSLFFSLILVLPLRWLLAFSSVKQT